MIIRFIGNLSATTLWIMGAILSSIAAFSLVGLLLLAPVWWAAIFGWALVTVNSLLAKVIYDRAIGASQKAFVGWGVAVNAARMLTVIVVFAYMTLNFKCERGSFLVAGLTSFFVMMPFEVMQLLAFQKKAGTKF